MSWVISIFLLLIAGLLFRIPYVLQDKIKDERNNKSTHDLQIESYFKQFGGGEQQKVLNEWSLWMYDSNKLNQVNQANYKDDLIRKTVLYASKDTLFILSKFNVYMKEKSDSKNDDTSDYDKLKQNVYLAFIISNLKEDFSGYSISPNILLNLTNYKLSENDKQNIEKIIDNISKETGKGNSTK